MLRKKQISYVVSGASSVDLTQAVNLLGEHFGIRTLLLEGGGHINGGFLEAGLVDEVSLLLLAAIDGRHDIPAVFDGVSDSKHRAVPLKLKIRRAARRRCSLDSLRSTPRLSTWHTALKE